MLTLYATTVLCQEKKGGACAANVHTNEVLVLQQTQRRVHSLQQFCGIECKNEADNTKVKYIFGEL